MQIEQFFVPGLALRSMKLWWSIQNGTYRGT
jgi:hypothetical protein